MGNHLDKLSAVGQPTRPTQPFILMGRLMSSKLQHQTFSIVSRNCDLMCRFHGAMSGCVFPASAGTRKITGATPLISCIGSSFTILRNYYIMQVTDAA